MPTASNRAAIVQEGSKQVAGGPSPVARPPTQPFKVDGGAPVTKQPTEGPPSALAKEAEGTRPDRWAPGIAANTAVGRTGHRSYGDAAKPRVPFRTR